MHARICKFASLACVALSIGASGCEDSSSGSSTAIHVGPTGPSSVQSRSVSVEPRRLAPDFVSQSRCVSLPPFRTRFNLFVNADRDFFLRRIGFEFRDRSGRRALPIALLTFITGGTVGRSIPVPIPTSPAIPIPGVLPFNGAPMSAPLSTLGLTLNFDCGVRADGTLFLEVETADLDGVADVLRVDVPIADSGS
jgi:hypothetical protein